MELCRTIRSHDPRPRYFNPWDRLSHSYLENYRHYQVIKRFNQFSPLRYEGSPSFPIAEKDRVIDVYSLPHKFVRIFRTVEAQRRTITQFNHRCLRNNKDVTLFEALEHIEQNGKASNCSGYLSDSKTIICIGIRTRAEDFHTAKQD